MKKFIFVMPLMAISLLASCGGSKPEPSVVYHTITFHSNGGSEVPVLKVEDGKLAIEPKEPTKVGLLFKGWYQEEALENYFSFSTKITKDYDLYANWQSKYDFTVTLQSEGMSTLEKNGGWLNQDDYKSEIHLDEEVAGKYELHASKGYYEVSVNGQVIKNFTIDKVEYSLNDYYVVITIPKEYLGKNIAIKSVPYCHYLTFTGEAVGAKIYYDKYGMYLPTITPDLEYCDDLNSPAWTKWEIGESNAVLLENANKTIYVRNKENTLSDYDGQIVFKTGTDGSSNVSADGNIMSLLNFGNLYNDCFKYLFRGAKSLITPPVLPSTTLAANCYSYMFWDCSKLAKAPELPATTLNVNCYDCMFGGCSITKAPELPATILFDDCYSGMFYNCSKLVEVPEELPATKLAERCYLSMFLSTAIDKAPNLPAITLAESCYQGMFYYCSKLKTAPELPATTLVTECYSRMFMGCTSLKINNVGLGTNFFTCPSDTSPEGCVSMMFEDTGGDITSDPEPNVTYYYE